MRVKKVYTIHYESSQAQSELMDKLIEATLVVYKELHPKIKYSISIMSNEKKK